MDSAEIGHRLLRAARSQAERSGLLGDARGSKPDLSVRPNAWIRTPLKLESRAACLAAAGRVAEGWLDVFAMRNVDLGSPPRWNRDPKTGIEAPLVFGKHLDYRDPDLVGDIKYLWEPNRHLHLVTLAQAYVLTREHKYVRALTEQLESWFIACPYGRGPNWASALEPAMRLINWSAAWQLLGGVDSPVFEAEGMKDFRQRWLASVHQHCSFIRGWFSLHSSANNHLIGEAAALFVASLTWPHWRETRAWLARAKKLLEREALAQNAPDGVNREQAVGYQQFVLELLLVCLLAGKANGQWFSAAYESRVEAMLDFLASVMDCGGNLPMIGDGDDGRVLGLDWHAPRSAGCRSLLATGAILFKRGDFKQKALALDDRTRWLLGRGADADFAALDAEKTRLPPRQQFPDGGYYVLGCELETPHEIRIVADAGPLGYRSIAAHGHADALSFTLSAGGREWLVDPGTFAYHTQPRWRAYFRGTAAHNTVRIDGEDQSEPGGNFMWLKKARAGCSLWLSSAERDTFEGWHDGYMRLPDPVKHRRLIQLDKAARRVLVEDSLEMAEEHDVELLFHFGERCSLHALEGRWIASQGEHSMSLELPENGSASLYRGSVSPIFGWVSREFDRRQPAPTLVWRARLDGNTVLRTEIALEANARRA